MTLLFALRERIRPHAFEAMAALYVAVIGMFGLAGSLPPSPYVGAFTLLFISGIYFAAGGMVLFARAACLLRIEMAGLLLMAAGAVMWAVVSGVALWQSGDWAGLGLGFLFHLFVALAAAGRFHALIAGGLVVTVRRP